MEKILVEADKRNESGKGSARTLRRAGIIPAIVYSEGNSTPIQLNTKIMTKLLMSGSAEHALITIALDGSDHPVIIKDFQMDPVSDELLHIDFKEVSLKEKLTVTVALSIVKQPIGVKLGGILQKVLREIEVECLPTNIPDTIEIDASHIDVGGNLHVSDLTVGEGVKILTDPKGVILSVKAPVVEAEPTEEEAAEAVEPELVGGKGKDEEEGDEKKDEGK